MSPNALHKAAPDFLVVPTQRHLHVKDAINVKNRILTHIMGSSISFDFAQCSTKFLKLLLKIKPLWNGRIGWFMARQQRINRSPAVVIQIHSNQNEPDLKNTCSGRMKSLGCSCCKSSSGRNPSGHRQLNPCFKEERHSQAQSWQ